jgi:5-formaminoimidazole-4-carboxamide-1-(beta)-D-ribofuranosyl 5'-monophosphate synthetase
MPLAKAADYRIGTLGSHSALQIFKGAHDEGFKTTAICMKGRERLYSEVYGELVDKILLVGTFKDYAKVQDEVVRDNTILVPHGSFVQHLGIDQNKRIRAHYFGNRAVLDWEADRLKQQEWMQRARLRLPKVFRSSEDIDRPAIIKMYGAAGGKGYFFCRDPEDFEEQKSRIPPAGYQIQEYIIGNTAYIHYFYSPLDGKLEIMSIDRRYETNVDSLGRIPLRNQRGLQIDPSFVVIGNYSLVLRESLLQEAYEMGERVVAASKKIAGPKGLFGPFCLETVVTPDMQFYTIEISARIVAGTNIFIDGSPYTALKYGVPMSTGRRIAREIKNAISAERLDEVLG